MKINSEINFIIRLSSQLEGFKITSGKNVFNFRCPICKDSQKKKSKKRGYIYQKNGKFFVFCHNCGYSKLFKFFLKEQNPTLYQEYLESVINPLDDDNFKEQKQVISIKTNVLNKFPKISKLPPNHIAKKYITDRQIPTNFHHELFYCNKFKQFVNSLIPNKFENIEVDESRIIIPINYEKKLVGFQGRSIGPSVVKYISIVLDETKKPLVWGIDQIQWNARHFVFEGVFDAMYINNSIAVCGSSLLSTMEELKKPKQYSILCWDNERRNKEIVNSMEKAIKKGYKICIWPDHIEEKDINSMILKRLGKIENYVQTEKVRQLGWELRIIIEENTYHGLNAELKLAEWRRS